MNNQDREGWQDEETLAFSWCKQIDQGVDHVGIYNISKTTEPFSSLTASHGRVILCAWGQDTVIILPP